jgi:hypothetical protein
VSQTYSSRAISRPVSTTAYYVISSVAPRFVHKSIHNMLRALRPVPRIPNVVIEGELRPGLTCK